MFKSYPYASIELNHLAEKYMVPVDELNWNLAYLEKAQYVELSKSYDSLPYIASTTNITREGIDLVEDYVLLEKMFPDADPPDDSLKRIS